MLACKTPALNTSLQVVTGRVWDPFDPCDTISIAVSTGRSPSPLGGHHHRPHHHAGGVLQLCSPWGHPQWDAGMGANSRDHVVLPWKRQLQRCCRVCITAEVGCRVKCPWLVPLVALHISSSSKRTRFLTDGVFKSLFYWAGSCSFSKHRKSIFNFH